MGLLSRCPLGNIMRAPALAAVAKNSNFERTSRCLVHSLFSVIHLVVSLHFLDTHFRYRTLGIAHFYFKNL